MAVYDLQEQEQIDDLKAWWQRYGNTVTTVALAVVVAAAAVQGWRWWSDSRAKEASALYAAVSDAVRKDDLAKAKDATAQLEDKFGSTAYASSAALLYAKMLYDSGDHAGARAQLSFAIDHGDEEGLRAIARYRLAQAMIDEKQYDDALRTLDAKHPDAFEAVYQDLRGDALGAAGRPTEARSAYQAALAKLDAKSPYKTYLQVKLDALGGPGAGDAASPTSASIAVPPATAAAAPASPPMDATGAALSTSSKDAAATTPPNPPASAAPAPPTRP